MLYLFAHLVLATLSREIVMIIIGLQRNKSMDYHNELYFKHNLVSMIHAQQPKLCATLTLAF